MLKLSAAEDTIRSLTVSEEELRESCAFYRRQMDEKDAQIKALLEQNANLTRATFSKKMHGYYPFKLNEVYAICDLLEIDNPREVFL